MLVKIMSFNIAHGEGMDGNVDLERIAKVIEASEADIVGLQEVDCNWERSRFENQAKWLGKRLNMKHIYAPNMEDAQPEAEKKWYGNAVLCRYPIKSVNNHSLSCVFSEGDDNEPRGVQELVISIEGVDLGFYNTHFAQKEKEFPVSTAELLAIVNACKLPCIITGDFNAAPEHDAIREITTYFKDVFYEEGKPLGETHPPSFITEEHQPPKPEPRIDYIFISKEWTVEKAEVIETFVSDHKPITAVIQLN